MTTRQPAIPVALALLAASATAVASAATADPLAKVDIATSITSKVPVPGGFTAGSWSVANEGQSTLPAGSSYIVKFSQLDGTATQSSLTVTTAGFNASAVKIGPNEFRVTLKSSLLPGQTVRGVWSDSHVFDVRGRDQVSFTMESTPGAVDFNAANNTSKYDYFTIGF